MSSFGRGVVIVATLTSGVAALAQSAEKVAFEAVSIREARGEASERPVMRALPSGLVATNTTALELIVWTYDLVERDVVGQLPEWTRTTRFDVTGRATSGPPLTRSQLHAMTRALLEDRFKLDAALESSEGPVYSLVLARSDRTLGPKMRPSESTCLGERPLSGEFVAPTNITGNCSFVYMGDANGLVGFVGSNITMRQLAAHLSRLGGFDRPVIDRTGLTGEFNVNVMRTNDIEGASSAAKLLTAMREQLGVTVRAEQTTFEVLRVRRIEQPSPN